MSCRAASRNSSCLRAPSSEPGRTATVTASSRSAGNRCRHNQSIVNRHPPEPRIPSPDMKKAAFKKKTLSLVLAASALCGVASLEAHHPVQAKFDNDQVRTLSGVVTLLDWSNPHAHVFVNVTQNGVTENWAVELESPVELKASGWNSKTVQPGDRVEVTGLLARNGTRQIWADSIVLSGTGREVFTLNDNPPVKPLVPRPTPRWPDGKIALGATPGSGDGYWGYRDETELVEDGVNVSFDRYGQL